MSLSADALKHQIAQGAAQLAIALTGRPVAVSDAIPAIAAQMERCLQPHRHP